MRELFDDAAGQSALDPQEAVRRTSRRVQRKRFYASAGITETSRGFGVALDDKLVRTPSRRLLIAPSNEIAAIIAAEWDAQKEVIDPTTMPVTRLANTVIDAVIGRVQTVADDIAKYFS